MPEPTHRLDYFVATGEASRKKRMRRLMVRIILALGGMVVATLIVVASYIGYFLYVQSNNMARADAHIPIIKAKIAGDSRFADITVEHFTAGNGCILANGTVSTQADLDALHQIVKSTSPPVYVFYVVTVGTLAQSQPILVTPPTQPTTSEVSKHFE